MSHKQLWVYSQQPNNNYPGRIKLQWIFKGKNKHISFSLEHFLNTNRIKTQQKKTKHKKLKQRCFRMCKSKVKLLMGCRMQRQMHNSSASIKRWCEYGLCVHAGCGWVLKKLGLKQALLSTLFHGQKEVPDPIHGNRLFFFFFFLD